MNDEFFASELAATGIGEGALVVGSMASGGRLVGVGDDGLRGGQVVGEVEEVEQVATPIRELAAAGFPEGAPASGCEVIAVGELGGERAAPEIPVEVFGNGLGWGVGAPGVGEVVAFGNAAGPDVGFDGSAELVRAQHFDGGHAAAIAGALVAHLSDEAGASAEAIADHAQFGELVDERFLAVDVFIMLHRREHGGGMVEVGDIDEHGIEVGDFVGEGFAIVAERPGVGELLFDAIGFASVDVAEAGPFDLGMAFEPAALEAADAADTDLEDAEFAILIGLSPSGEREGGDADGCDGAASEEVSAGDGGK